VLENHRGVMERKHKLVRQHQPGSSSRPRVATSSAGPMFRPAQPQFQLRSQAAGQGFSTQQHQVIQRPNNLQTLAAGNQRVQRTQATEDPQQAYRRCYNYGEKGHYANRRPNSCTHANQSAIATPAPYPWSQLCSCCCQAELCPWESQSCGRGRSIRSS
jgi:hypothetical protein